MRPATPSLVVMSLVVMGLAVMGLAACQPKVANEVVIGASLPLSGALASFGGFQKWGYEHAVAEVNAAGGIKVDGALRPVRLIIRDHKTDPNVASANIDTLISAEHAAVLLGSCTPPLVIATALAAERNATPLVTGCAPLASFRAVKTWTWAWDLFFNEPDLAEAPFHAWQELKMASNHKIAFLHDNGVDGTALGAQIWPALALKYGYQVVANVAFPTDTTDFSASVQQAKSTGADVVMVDAVTPQMVSIRKQLAAAGIVPKLLVMEKGAEPAQFAEAVGALADGVLVGGYWDPSFAYAGAAELGAAYARETHHSVSQHIADSYTAARVLLDAIAAAGSTDRERINRAIGATHKTYPVGPVQFGENHAAALQIAELQWQHGVTQVVWPVDRKTASFLFPVPTH